MWHRPGSKAVQRPTSLVWVLRVAISRSSVGPVGPAEVR